MFAKLIGWFLPFKKQLLVLGIVLALGAGCYLQGRADGAVKCATAAKAATLEGVKTHARTEREVIRLDDPDLDSRLAKWMRD